VVPEPPKSSSSNRGAGTFTWPPAATRTWPLTRPADLFPQDRRQLIRENVLFSRIELLNRRSVSISSASVRAASGLRPQVVPGYIAAQRRATWFRRAHTYAARGAAVPPGLPRAPASRRPSSRRPAAAAGTDPALPGGNPPPPRRPQARNHPPPPNPAKPLHSRPHSAAHSSTGPSAGRAHRTRRDPPSPGTRRDPPSPGTRSRPGHTRLPRQPGCAPAPAHRCSLGPPRTPGQPAPGTRTQHPLTRPRASQPGRTPGPARALATGRRRRAGQRLRDRPPAQGATSPAVPGRTRPAKLIALTIPLEEQVPLRCLRHDLPILGLQRPAA
jgi:hypothetical protein